jgi:nitroimidazol reductase NimA-like FMN-containing flavoprotein (pyridoxamine 5'-phosphate oxidase superfamily)
MRQSRTRIRRHPERALAVPEEAEAILGEALVAHVGIVQDGQPFVIPMTFYYRDGVVYIHGAPGSRTVKVLASGAPACVEVTLVDGLIASKSAETHSVNYRSVICLGRGALVRDKEQRREILEAMIARYFPGRTAGADYHPITEQEDKATRLVAVHIEEMSAKGRSGGPRGPLDADPDAPGNAGVHAVATGV